MKNITTLHFLGHEATLPKVPQNVSDIARISIKKKVLFLPQPMRPQDWVPHISLLSLERCAFGYAPKAS